MLRRFLLVFFAAALVVPGHGLAAPYVMKRERTLAAAGAPTRTAAVILFNFAGDARRPYTVEQARRVLFDGEGSVNTYLRESSYGRVGLAGDVFGWFTIPESPAGCRFAQWGRAALDLAEAAGVAVRDYQHQVLVFPHVPACDWPGMAELPGSVAWINGELTVRLVAHELVHNLGAHHAGGLRCVERGVRVAVGGNCSVDEYGDPFDVMGAGARHTSNWNKAKLGWLTASNLATATATGTFALAAQEALTAEVQLLRVPRGDGLFYYLELRQPFGSFFDNFAFGDPAVRGITVRLAPDYPGTAQSQLIDTTPETEAFEDAPLAVGRTFADPQHGVWVVNRGILGGKATVEVSLGAPPARPGPATTAGTRSRVVRGVRLVGRAGNDVLRGRSHKDVLSGGRGRDTLLGGAGDDRLDGGPGRDVLHGEPGNDRIIARDGGLDSVRCGAGRDVVLADHRDVVGRDCEIVKRV